MPRWKFWGREEKLKKKEVEKSKTVEKSLLEELCERYEIPYSVISMTLPMDPRGRNIEELEKRGMEYEKNKDIRARGEYWSAGGLALYLGNLDLVQRYFGKCAELTQPNSEYRKNFEYLTKKENIEKVLKLAKEYYEKTLKPIEEKKT